VQERVTQRAKVRTHWDGDAWSGRGGAERRGLHFSFPRRTSWRLQERCRGWAVLFLCVFSFVLYTRCPFLCNSLGVHHIFLGQAWAEGKGGAGNGPPLRGQRTGNGLYIIPP